MDELVSYLSGIDPVLAAFTPDCSPGESQPQEPHWYIFLKMSTRSCSMVCWDLQAE